jgi:HAD superfamily hydrolase (TIGR01456 family)
LPIRAVLVVHDSRDWGLEIQIISELLQAEGGILGTRRDDLGVGKQDLEVIFCNPDLLFGSDYPTSRYGAGAFKSALKAIHKEATGHDVKITQLGKPHKQTYDFAQSMLVEHLKHISGGQVTSVDKTIMVGDNPASDIAGANAAKWSSLLVRTGVYKDVQGPPAHQPTRIVDNVEAGVRWALEKEGLL